MFFKSTLLAALVVAAPLTGAAETLVLRGYGSVAADFAPGRATFRCESPEKADILYAKLYNDLTRMGTEAPAELKQGNVPVLRFGSGRVAVIGRDGNTVVVLDEVSPEAAKLAFPERKPYPVHFDYYDLRALKFYKASMSSLLGRGLETHWPFAKKHHVEGFVVHTGFAPELTPAPGIINFTATDYALEDARKHGGLVTLCGTFGGGLPLWLYNDAPENTAKVQRSTIVTEWQHGVEAGSYEGYGPGYAPEKSPLRAHQKLVMERYRNHPNLGGWQLYRGAPIGDQLGMGMGGVLWDDSLGAKKMFAAFLRERYKTQEELNRAWQTKAFTFERAAEAQLMDLIGADYECDRLLLSDREWEWRLTPEGGNEQPPVADGKPWVKLRLAPSQRAQYLDAGSAYYRLLLDAPEFLKAWRDKTLHLKAAVYGYDSSCLVAWVNGKFFKGKPVGSHDTKLTGIEIPAGAFKGDGSDEIVLQTPSGRHRGDGRIHGPISLSPNPAENFPYRDAGVNARYRDLKDFQIDALIRRNLDMYRYARNLDPDRPLSISGADAPILGALAPYLARNGVAIQSTSIDAFYWPQFPDWGRLHGFHFVGESSQPLRKENFDRVLGQQFYMGTSATAIFMDIEQYMKLEEETQLMSGRAPLLRLLGKYMPEIGDIGILTTAQTYQAGGIAPWNWNLGRGELQSSHFPSCMITEKELESGLASRFRVIIDASDVMAPETVAAIGRYIEAGGTFIATPASGRHTMLEQNARPLAKISGFRAEDGAMTGSIKFSEKEDVFPAWRGKTFNGAGNALDWKSNPASVGCRLTPLRLDAEVVASWPDGSAAVGVRKLGKGKIITLGSGFFRDARDIAGVWLPSKRNELQEAFFTQLGVERRATAESERIWVRAAIAKNGLEEWIVAANVAPATEAKPEIVTAIHFRPEIMPLKVRDAVTGKEVVFSRNVNGSITIPELRFAQHETRIFALTRPVAAAEALKTWWAEKKHYMQMTPPAHEPDPAPLPETVLNFDRWQFKADPDNAIGSTEVWLHPGFAAEDWRETAPGSWKVLRNDLADYKGTALYRRVFQLPKAWNGRTVAFYFYTRSAIQDKAEFYLNGKKFLEFDRSKQHNELHGLRGEVITELLNQNGENVLAVKVTGGSTVLAGVLDNLYCAIDRRFEPSINLNGDWNAFNADLLTSELIKVPADRVRARYLQRTFAVPAEWKGKRIFLRLETPEINISSAVINNRGKGLNGAFPPFGNRTEINISDFVRPGETNTIELWHRHTIPTNWIGLQWKWPKESNISVSNITIGVSAD